MIVPFSIKKISIKLLLLILAVGVVAYIIWWWLDSALSCNEQDEYSLRGICLMRAKELAENGDKRSQRLYGNYLAKSGKSEQAIVFHGKYFAQASRGLDFDAIPIEAYCAERVPGFEAETISAAMLKVAMHSQDVHLSLLRFHLGAQCAFSLDRASYQIPKLNQCAHTTLKNFLIIAERNNYTINKEIVQAISKNIGLCRAELSSPPVVGNYVVESIPVRQQDITDMENRLDAWKNGLRK